MMPKKYYEDTPQTNLGGGVSDQLRAYVAQIEAIEDKMASLSREKSAIYKEARAVGLCKATIRRLIEKRRKDKEQQHSHDDLLALYEQVLQTKR